MIESKFFEIYASNLKFVFISSSSNLASVDLSKSFQENYKEIIFSEDELCSILRKTYKNLEISDEKLKQYLKLCNNDFGLIKNIICISQKKIIDYCDELPQIEKVIFNILEKHPRLNVLEIATIIGLAFDINILKNLCGLELTELVQRLKEAYSLGFLINENEYNYEFLSDFIKDIIYKHGTQNSLWHKKYADEINRLSPDEHALIAYHYNCGNNYQLSFYHYWANMLTNALDRKEISSNNDLDEIEEHIKNKILWHSCLNYVKGLLREFIDGQLEKNRIISCLKIKYYDSNEIEEIKHFTQLALLYIGKYTHSQNEFYCLGKALENSYNFLKNNNLLGLQIRCALYIIDIYSYRLNESQMAKKMLTELNEISHDIMFNLGNNSLLLNNNTLILKIIRKTSVLYNSELAYERTKQLLLICKDYQNTIDEIEMYKFLNDHLGYALYSGYFNDISSETINGILQINSLGESLNFPKTYKLRMNIFIYNVFLNNLNFAQIRSFFQNEIKTKKINSSMYNFDLASIAILCYEFDFAENILLNLYSELDRNKTCFYHYSYNANLTALYILKGDYKKAKYYNDKIINTNFSWYEEYISIMKFRANKLNSFINDKKVFTPNQLFNCFADIPIVISRTWLFLRKGILFSELMFYRE